MQQHIIFVQVLLIFHFWILTANLDANLEEVCSYLADRSLVTIISLFHFQNQILSILDFTPPNSYLKYLYHLYFLVLAILFPVMMFNQFPLCFYFPRFFIFHHFLLWVYFPRFFIFHRFLLWVYFPRFFIFHHFLLWVYFPQKLEVIII